MSLSHRSGERVGHLGPARVAKAWEGTCCGHHVPVEVGGHVQALSDIELLLPLHRDLLHA